MFCASSTRSILTRRPIPSSTPIFSRARNNLAPRQVKHSKRHKGRVPIPIGGSTRGTTLAYGDWGLRIKGNGVRLSAKQLEVVDDTIKKKLKVLKGVKVYLRVFPDIPVCIKGNETRMGKGKGTFEFWATRQVRYLLAFHPPDPRRSGFLSAGSSLKLAGFLFAKSWPEKVSLRLAAAKLPTKMEFISRLTPPRLGNLILPPKPSQSEREVLAPDP
ncbi:54S ribosomal protein L16, mitochondrial [Mycena indigotica]|uniref:54S ribosomal protein L16, mitochondrial n=1 Tax=Mycena indigotica TaxID=2126181 RepID=A0A8H6RZ45_9AGAR|nr:54S ribosomal protein L16, mitochondrial [Mycena indigotica]KAF7289984.1 54S ribosomal protein L16, mitochondrial [Mycena indigotica]